MMVLENGSIEPEVEAEKLAQTLWEYGRLRVGRAEPVAQPATLRRRRPVFVRFLLAAG